MPNYRRLFVPGGTYFFTVNAADRNDSILTDNIGLLRAAFRTVKTRHPFDILSIVVLPDHLHTVWRLPEGDADYSLRWRWIKSHFSRHVQGAETRSASQVRRRERDLWQNRFWEHMIRDDESLERHIHYCHLNPVKHGHCGSVADWPYSSYHRDVSRSIVPSPCHGDPSMDWNAGER
ncbi:MAG: transposase [Alphaproteobacteria bacterium]